MANKRISGTREWASVNVNCVIGCRHNCRYCFARYNAIVRFKNVKPADWDKPRINWKEVNKKRPKYDGVVMFPTTHDILPEVLDACLTCLRNLLEAGNDVLIVSKPHPECIQAICDAFGQYKDHILFRFTIGAINNDILKYWEPGAPSFEDRLTSLRIAYDKGFETSVSAEPMLDMDHAVELFDTLVQFVTDAIWIGKMNRINQRVKMVSTEDELQVEKIENSQTDTKVWNVYNTLKDRPQIKWKESIKEVVGLPLATEAGLDV